MTWLIVGGGVSGEAAALLLRSRRASVRLCDKKQLTSSSWEKLSAAGVEIIAGDDQSPSLLDGIAALVVSPSMSPAHPLAKEASTRRLPILTDIELGLEGYQGSVVAVTGTNGKSTICAMTAHILQRSGLDTTLVGNIGTSPCAVLLRDGKLPDYLVLEVSSYQLEWMKQLRCRVAVFCNFAPDHQSRHGDMDSYFKCKWKIFDGLVDSGRAFLSKHVYERAESMGIKLPQGTNAEIIDKPLEMSEIDNFLEHDRWNASFAISAAAAMTGTPKENLAASLATYAPLPFRCVRLGSYSGRPVVNDSKSTTLHSTVAAVRSFGFDKTVLLVGGEFKGEPFSTLKNLASKVTRVIAFGACADQIQEELAGTIPITTFTTLKEALLHWDSFADLGDSVVFSPGCASFDEFQNFVERGKFFDSLVLPLLDHQ